MSVVQRITSSRYSFPIFISTLLAIAVFSLGVSWYFIAAIERDRVTRNSDMNGELLLRCRKADCFEGALVNFSRGEAATPTNTSLKFLNNADLTYVSKVLAEDEHFSDFAGVLAIDLLGECEALSGDLRTLTSFRFDPLPQRPPPAPFYPPLNGGSDFVRPGEANSAGPASGVPMSGNPSFNPPAYGDWAATEAVAEPELPVHSCRARFSRSEEEHGGWLYCTKILAWLGIKVLV